MSDDVKAAITDALEDYEDRLFPYGDDGSREKHRPALRKRAEFVFDAAVKPLLAENVELREDVAALQGRLKRLLADNDRLREEVARLQDLVVKTVEQRDERDRDALRYREAMEAVRVAAEQADDRVIYGLADDALDGDR